MNPARSYHIQKDKTNPVEGPDIYIVWKYNGKLPRNGIKGHEDGIRGNIPSNPDYGEILIRGREDDRTVDPRSFQTPTKLDHAGILDLGGGG